MNQMEIFKNPEFGSIRVIEENGKYLFSGTDVAAALGYSNPRDAIIRHCRYVVKRDAPHPQSLDRKISMTFIPEGDLYRLIVHSKLPSAERFEQWVFDEVLPTIRKHGAYLTKEKLWEVATSPEALMKLCSDLLAERCPGAPVCSVSDRTAVCVPHGIRQCAALCQCEKCRAVLRQRLLQPRSYRFLHAGHAPGQALFCSAAGDDLAGLIRTERKWVLCRKAKQSGS